MPIASLSVSKSLLGIGLHARPPAATGSHCFTASLMLGAAIGGIALGQPRRPYRTHARHGRQYPLLLGLRRPSGRTCRRKNRCCLLRFMVGLGVGGMWPNGIALVSECWPSASKPLVSGVMMAGLNAGILLLSQLARLWPITRRLVALDLPALRRASAPRHRDPHLRYPESPEWLAASRTRQAPPRSSRGSLSSPQLLRIDSLRHRRQRDPDGWVRGPRASG